MCGRRKETLPTAVAHPKGSAAIDPRIPVLDRKWPATRKGIVRHGHATARSLAPGTTPAAAVRFRTTTIAVPTIPTAGAHISRRSGITIRRRARILRPAATTRRRRGLILRRRDPIPRLRTPTPLRATATAEAAVRIAPVAALPTAVAGEAVEVALTAEEGAAALTVVAGAVGPTAKDCAAISVRPPGISGRAFY